MLIAGHKVTYISFGIKVSEFVKRGVEESPNSLEQRLAEKLGIDSTQIIKHSFEVKLESDLSEIKNDDLSLVLVSLQSASLSGSNLLDSLMSILNDLYENINLNSKLKIYKLQGKGAISQVFERLAVNPVVTTLIKTGEFSGGIDLSFDQAINFLEADQESANAIKSGVGKSVLYVVMGLLLTFVVPVPMANFFNDLLSALNKNPTNTTNYLNYMSDHLLVFFGFFVALILSIIFGVRDKNTYKILKDKPVFKLFEDISALKRAIVFLPFYSSLNEAGMNDKRIVDLFSGIDLNLSKNLLKHIKEDFSLAQAIDKSELPKDLSASLSVVLSIEGSQNKERAFKGLIKLLNAKLIKKSEKVSQALSITGYVLISVGILTILLAYATMSEVIL